jgi:hypothetical protein
MSTVCSAILKPGSTVHIMRLTLGIPSAIWTSLTFRFNRRNTPMAAFQPLLWSITQKTPLPLWDLDVLSQP